MDKVQILASLVEITIVVKPWINHIQGRKAGFRVDIVWSVLGIRWINCGWN